jgi:hypothetical protein
MKIRLMLSFLAVGSLSSFVPEKLEENIPVVEIEEIVVSEPPKAHQLDELIEAIGQLESNNRYDVVNPYGFMGKYQFSPRTVAYLGYDVTREQFLNNPELQDSVMVSYLRSNYSSLQHHIMVYGYTIHNGVYITPSSVLAGAHFAGARGMKRFLENNVGTTDSNGMTITRYMEKFTDYELNLEDL